MARGHVPSIYDAVHGAIDLYDPALFPHRDTAALLLETPQLQRLRRLKQLPFGSYGFLGADHTRFAHALGTAHIALRILQRLHRVGFFSEQTVTSLRESLPDLGDTGGDDLIRRIGEHVVACGLLQDIGELPYSQAADLFLAPHATVSSRVADELEVPTLQLSGKDTFTLNAIIDILHAHRSLRDRLDINLLAYLVAGIVTGEIKESPALRAVRQIVDGVVDADRLDYVHRDAYHTIGASISASAEHVIGSLLMYDENGPVFNTVGPVSNFLMLRAILRSQVYSAPDVRFRVTLLAVALSELLKRHPDWMMDYFGAQYGGLSADAFQRLDDGFLLSQLDQLRASVGAELLDANVRQAIDLVSSHAARYEYFWIERPKDNTPTGNVRLRPDIFVDTYWDYESHRLYRPASVRVAAAPYTLLGETVPLEAAGGHVSDFLHTLWDSPAVRDKVLLYVPETRVDWFLRMQTGAAETLGALYWAARERDSKIRLSVVDDARSERGHSGPAIFVSFCWEDIDSMRVVLRLLYDARRRYFAFVEDFSGLGGDTRANGATYAGQADAAIILLSPAYVRNAANTNGNIYPELVALGRSLPPNRIIPISLDPKSEYGESLGTFPWLLIGYDKAPFLGAPVRHATPEVISRALGAALRKIDEDHVGH